MCYLNTSHVKVKQFILYDTLNRKEDLNTSHVKVKQVSHRFFVYITYYLNTSHVKVKPWPFMALFKYIII